MASFPTIQRYKQRWRPLGIIEAGLGIVMK